VTKFKIDNIYNNIQSFNTKKNGFPNGTVYAGKPIKIQKTNKAILIRKHDLNQYLSLSNCTKPRPVAKMLESHGLSTADLGKPHANYIDSID
jgi:hypothetical protein